MSVSLLKIVSNLKPKKKNITRRQTYNTGNPRGGPLKEAVKKKKKRKAVTWAQSLSQGWKNSRRSSDAGTDSNTQNYLALEGSHGQPFKESWLVIGCSWLRCSQVSLMRVTERKGEKENTAPDTPENRDHYIMHVVLQAAWSVGFFTSILNVSSQCMRRRTRTGTEELRQRALKVGHLHSYCLQRTMKRFFLQQHTGECVRECVHWNNSYLMERSWRV